MELTDPRAWAAAQWAGASLGDVRRARRAVAVGSALAAAPGASLPEQAGSWRDLKAAYRLFSQPQVTHDALSAPHWAATRAAASQLPVTLFLQDSSDLDYTHHPATAGLGMIGDGKGQGLAIHSCLAVVPGEPPGLSGLAYARVWARTGPPKRGTETKTQRGHRWTEADLWGDTLDALGDPPHDCTWVSVGDRGSDVFSYLRRARERSWHCLLRVFQNRRIVTAEGAPEHLIDWTRTLPARATSELALSPRGGQPARAARLSLAWSVFALVPPRLGRQDGGKNGTDTLALTALRCWEEPGGQERGEKAPATKAPAPLEWILVTTLPVGDEAAARQVLRWYALRWLIEEYHKCLKTGCRVEERQLASGHALQALLGFLCLVAVRLLQLRELSRTAPETALADQAPPGMARLVAARLSTPPSALTVRQFWREVARLGGFIGRARDGDPGWQTVWRGWSRLQDMAQGMALAQGG